MLQSSYRVLSFFFLGCVASNIAIYKNFNTGLPLGFLISIFLLLFADKYAFRKHASLVDALTPIFLINIFLLFFFYISRYDLHIPQNYFRVGFTYDNFWDFYYQLLTAADGTYKSISSGYLPLSQAISKGLSLLGHWDGHGPNVGARSVNIYVLFYSICISPIFLYIKDIKKINANLYYLTVFLILSSYPFIFSFERGNFVLLSFFFLSLSLYFFSKASYEAATAFISVFFCLKIFNFILLPFFLRHFKGRYWIQAAVMMFFVTFGSLIYLFGIDFGKWRIFSDVFFAPFQGITDNLRELYVVTDGGALQGMSSWDSYRILLSVFLSNTKSNLTTNASIYNLAYALSGLLILILYYKKNWRVSESNCYAECLTLLMIGMAFHTGSADYNLLLLTPLIVILLRRFDFAEIQDIVKPLFILFSLLGGYVIYLISLEPNSKVYLSVSLKSMLTPFFLTYSIFKCMNFRKCLT